MLNSRRADVEGEELEYVLVLAGLVKSWVGHVPDSTSVYI